MASGYRTAGLIKEKKLQKANFRFWNADFGFKEFYLILIDRAQRFHQSAIRNPQSKIQNSNS